jgi:hypothetical protein
MTFLPAPLPLTATFSPPKKDGRRSFSMCSMSSAKTCRAGVRRLSGTWRYLRTRSCVIGTSSELIGSFLSDVEVAGRNRPGPRQRARPVSCLGALSDTGCWHQLAALDDVHPGLTSPMAALGAAGGREPRPAPLATSLRGLLEIFLSLQESLGIWRLMLCNSCLVKLLR